MGYTSVASVPIFVTYMCSAEVAHVSKATLRRFAFGDASSPCASFLSRGAFASGAAFGFFFTMTPLRAGFGGFGFLEGADAGFGAAADTVSVGGTGGGDLTVTLAATAL
jgi:hypothetical protein